MFLHRLEQKFQTLKGNIENPANFQSIFGLLLEARHHYWTRFWDYGEGWGFHCLDTLQIQAVAEYEEIC